VAPRLDWDGVSVKFLGNPGPDTADLRRYLLYWDRIDFPDNNLTHIPSDLVVDSWASSIESRSTLDFLYVPDA
jgi:hypothetical protein